MFLFSKENDRFDRCGNMPKDKGNDKEINMKQNDDKIINKTESSKEKEETLKYQHWMDVAFQEYARSGALDHLCGKGKPLHVQDGDIMSSVLKEAGFIPPWLELQHKIRDQLLDIIERLDSLDEQALQKEVDGINQLIAKLNREVPSPQLQKTRIFPDIIQKQLKHWI